MLFAPLFRSGGVSEAWVCCSFGPLALSWAMPRQWRTVWGKVYSQCCTNIHKEIAFLITLHVSLSPFRLVQAGLANVSIFPWRNVSMHLLYLLARVSLVLYRVWYSLRSDPFLFVCVHVCSALGAFSRPYCEKKEPTHDSWGCQGPVGQNLWFHRRHQAF